MEKLTESLKEIDIEKNSGDLSEKVQEDKTVSATFQQTSLAASSTSKSETITNVKMEQITESLKEIDNEKNAGDLSEKVQKGKTASATFQPTSSAGSSTSQIKRLTKTKRKRPTDSPKESGVEKNPGAPSEEEGKSVPMNLAIYLDSIKISAIISTGHFLNKRLPYLKKLVDEAVKLQTFMESVNNLRHEFQPCSHTSLNCLTMIPDEWRQLTSAWEISLKQIGGLIGSTNALIQECEDSSLLLRDEFVSYLENLFVVSEDLSELEETCDQALTKYRRVCFNFDNYLFLLHISTMNPHLKPLQERLMQECGKFSSFEAEIGEQIKQAEEKAEDLF